MTTFCQTFIDEVVSKIKMYKNKGHKIEITDNLVTIYELENNDEVLRQYKFKRIKELIKKLI